MMSDGVPGGKANHSDSHAPTAKTTRAATTPISHFPNLDKCGARKAEGTLINQSEVYSKQEWESGLPSDDLRNQAVTLKFRLLSI